MIVALIRGGLLLCFLPFACVLITTFEGIAPLTLMGLVAIGCGFGLFALLEHVVTEKKSQGFFAIGIAAVVLATATGVIASGQGCALFGLRARQISILEAPQHPWASVFHFRDGAAHPELMGESVVFGGGAEQQPHPVDRAYAVPVLTEGWTRQQPVTVWAVATQASLPTSSVNGPLRRRAACARSEFT